MLTEDQITPLEGVQISTSRPTENLCLILWSASELPIIYQAGWEHVWNGLDRIHYSSRMKAVESVCRIASRARRTGRKPASMTLKSRWCRTDLVRLRDGRWQIVIYLQSYRWTYYSNVWLFFLWGTNQKMYCKTFTAIVLLPSRAPSQWYTNPLETLAVNLHYSTRRPELKGSWRTLLFCDHGWYLVRVYFIWVYFEHDPTCTSCCTHRTLMFGSFHFRVS